MQSILPGLSSVNNIHPLFVHFPIALLPTALFVELIALWRQDPFLHRMARGLVYLGAVAAVVTAVTGEMAMDRLGHDVPGHDLVHIHRNFMLASTASAVLLAVFLFVTRERTGSFALAGAVWLALLVAVLLLGADRGGRLVFKHGMGVHFAPATASPDEHRGHHAHGEQPHGEGEQAGHSAGGHAGHER